jgi:hypothetical protein
MWLPSNREPMVVSFYEEKTNFRGQLIRIITLKDLTPEFKLDEQAALVYKQEQLTAAVTLNLKSP